MGALRPTKGWTERLFGLFDVKSDAVDNSLRVSLTNVSQFNENVVVERTPIIELDSSLGVSQLRNVTLTSGSGAISATASGEILLSTGATASSRATLRSGERGRYVPGYGAEMGIGVRVPVLPTGNQNLRWGLWDTQDPTEGFYFGVDATGPYVAYTRNSVETKIRQSEWNGDPLDGTGPSGLTLDLTDGYIYRVEFTWYGYGQIKFEITTTVNNLQRTIVAHSLRIRNSTSVQSPNLAVCADADNGGDASDIDLYVGGRNYSVVGRYIPIYRMTGEARAGVSTGTTSVPIVSFRRKSGFLDRSIRVQGFEVDVASQPVVLEVRIGGTLTGASFGTPTNHEANETALEADVSATAITGGTIVYTQYQASGQGNNPQGGSTAGTLLRFDVPEDRPVSLCARTLSGSGSISGHLRMTEEW